MAPGTPLPLWKRLAWFGAIWVAGVVGLGCVATLLRFWLRT